MKPDLAGLLLGLLALLGVLALNGCTWRSATAVAGGPTPFQPAPAPESPTSPAAAPTVAAAPEITAAPTPRRATTATPITPAAAIDGSGYMVQSGDTLPAIALRFHIEPLDLMRANHIANASSIYPGQVLFIPGGASTEKRILVDISEQRLYAYEGERQVFQFVVSTGAADGTLTGKFSILDKLPKAYSMNWGFWMPAWMGIYYVGPEIENGFHALPLLPDGTQIWGSSLGTPISYGCVVLAPADAQRLYDWAEVGTLVEIQG